MDPASAIGAASAVISFVEFSYKFLRLTYDIVKATDEDERDFSAVEAVAAEVQRASAELLAQPASSGTLNSRAASVRRLARQCRRVATKLLECVAETKSKKPGRIRHKLAAAIRTICSREELAQLQKNLDTCSTELHFAVQAGQNDQIAASLERLETAADAFHAQQQLLREKANEQSILDAIAFGGINQRHDTIAVAAEDTFRWMLTPGVWDSATFRKDARRDAAGRFLRWLVDEDGIFHIKGKLGTGKSTMMKLLVGHPKTRELLQEWAGEKKLVLASCFFWKPGTEEQKSLTGLMRSLLHDILRQTPAMICELFPHLWDPNNFDVWTYRSPAQMSVADIRDAFEALVESSSSPDSAYRYCLFIDGLDEFDDPHETHMDLVDLLCKWSQAGHGDKETAPGSNNLKLCVSSREHAVFETRLRAQHVVRMQEVNAPDIRTYVSQRLQKQAEDPDCFSDPPIALLCDEIVERSSGMFLWTYVVLKHISSKRLRRGEPVDYLMDTVRAMPSELQSLFTTLLDSVPVEERRRVAATLLHAANYEKNRYNLVCRIIMGERGQPRPGAEAVFDGRQLQLHYYLHRIVDDPAYYGETVRFAESNEPDTTPEQLEQLEARMRDWINSQCQGLLEVKDDSVFFVHRSVPEFAAEHVTPKWCDVVRDFDANIAFVQAATCSVGRIRQLKHVDYWFFFPPRLQSDSFYEALYEFHRISAICLTFPHDPDSIIEWCIWANIVGLALWIARNPALSYCGSAKTLHTLFFQLYENVCLNRDFVLILRHLLQHGVPCDSENWANWSENWANWFRSINVKVQGFRLADQRTPWVFLEELLNHTDCLPVFSLTPCADAKVGTSEIIHVPIPLRTERYLRDLERIIGPVHEFEGPASLADIVRFYKPGNSAKLLDMLAQKGVGCLQKHGDELDELDKREEAEEPEQTGQKTPMEGESGRAAGTKTPSAHETADGGAPRVSDTSRSNEPGKGQAAGPQKDAGAARAVAPRTSAHDGWHKVAVAVLGLLCVLLLSRVAA